MEAYFDNSATTACLKSVADIVSRVMLEDYGNPSSMHRKGVEAEQYIRYAKEIIAKNLKISEKEILFTSGGTESDNLALIGTAMAYYRSGKHLVTTAIEHPAILQTMKYLESQGFEVTYLPVDGSGRVNPQDLKKVIRRDTILVSIMHTNNEIGSVQPIEEIGNLIKAVNPQTIFHVDAVQGFGKAKILPKKMKIDLMSVSSHKIHGPKGVGFLYISDKVKLKPLIFGGGQQNGMRSGTENVPGIAGMGKAIEILYEHFNEDIERLYQLKDYFIQKVTAFEGVYLNGLSGRDSAPHIVSISVKGIRSEVLLHALEEKNIYVSAGSACSAHKKEASATLQAIGIDKGLLDSTIRFSFSVLTTQNEIDYTIKVMSDLLPFYRKYQRQ